MFGEQNRETRMCVLDCVDSTPVGGASGGQCPGETVIGSSAPLKVECRKQGCMHPLLNRAVMDSTVSMPGANR